MSTADEILARMADFDARMASTRAAFAAQVNALARRSIVRLGGREVCARRARTLRRRGDYVEFDHWTTRGKCRYRWLRRLEIVGAAS